MSNTIGSISARETSWPDLPTEDPELHDHSLAQADAEKNGICADPTSVIGGMVCGDETAISNACRRAAPGSVDAWLCDDRNLKKVQDGALEIAKKAAIKALELFFGAKVPR